MGDVLARTFNWEVLAVIAVCSAIVSAITVFPYSRNRRKNNKAPATFAMYVLTGLAFAAVMIVARIACDWIMDKPQG